MSKGCDKCRIVPVSFSWGRIGPNLEFEIYPYSSNYYYAKFDCGVPYLNEWLRNYARQKERRSEARTFIAVETSVQKVLGFYSVNVTELTEPNSPSGKPRRLPAVLLASLAVDSDYHGQGIGQRLLFHAVSTAVSASVFVGISVILVDVLEDGLYGFYEPFGFRRLDPNTRRMALNLNQARKMIIEL